MESKRIQDRIRRIKEEVAYTALKCHRDISSIQIMAVTKKASVEQIVEARNSGLDLFGENYIKDASIKINSLLELGGVGIEHFHFIGHLQSNKVKKATSLFSSIDSVDSILLANQIAKSVSKRDNPYPILLEVKTSNDNTKFGFDETLILNFFEEIIQLDKISVQGLMTIGKLNGSEKDTRTCFQALVCTKEKIEKRYQIKIPILSMGMSSDFKIAIEEGSNMLRIGNAIFGG